MVMQRERPQIFSNEGLRIKDTDGSHVLIVKVGSDLTADRILTITPGDAARTITLTGNPTLADWFDQSVKAGSSPTFVNLTITSFAANWTNAGRTVADLGIVTTVDINGGSVDSLTSLSIRSTGAAFDLTLATATVFSAGRTLTIDPGDAARTITLTGNPTLADWFDQSVKAAASPTFVNLTLSTGQVTITGGVVALQQATTISTTSTTLTLAPATTLEITPGTFITNITGAAGTSNQVLAIINTSNTAAASHAYVDISVGGTTSLGDPHVRFTIPGGTSWYIGADNSNGDRLEFGTGTAVGSNLLMLLYGATTESSGGTINSWDILPAALTLTAASDGNVNTLVMAGRTVTLATTTTRTSLFTDLTAAAVTIAQSGGAVTVNKAAGISSIGHTAGASVTLTHSSAFRALTGGAAVNVSGLYVEAQTAGTTASYGILLAASTTGDITGITTLKISSLDGAITIAPSAGSLLFTGTLALTGSRVTQSYHTNITSTNAVTVDSWSASKELDHLYTEDALAILRGVEVISFRHLLDRDPSGRMKLGVRAESILEPLALIYGDYGHGLGIGPMLDTMGLTALNTKAIQQADARLTALEADDWLKEQIRARKDDPEFRQLLRDALV